MRIGELEALTSGRCRRAAWPLARLPDGRQDRAGPVGTGAAGTVRCRHRARATRWTEPPTGPCSRALPPTGCAPRLGGPAPRPGVPAFSPHDLRHRRISLRHLQGDAWATIGADVGQRNLSVTANTYTHVLDRRGRGRLRNTQPLPMMPSLCQKWSQLVGPVVVPSDSTAADFGPPPATTSA